MRRTEGENGSAMISAVVLLVLVGIVGIILMRTTRGEARSSLAQVHDREAYYLAQSGLETAKDNLRAGVGALAAAAGPNGRIDFSAEAVRAIYDGSGRPIGFTGYGDDRPLRPFTPLAEGAYAAFVTAPAPDGGILVTGVGAAHEPSFARVQATLAGTP